MIPGAYLGLIDQEEFIVIPDRGESPWRFATTTLTKSICLVVFMKSRVAQNPAAPISDPGGSSEWWRRRVSRVPAEGLYDGE